MTARKPFGHGWLWTDDPRLDDSGIPRGQVTWLAVFLLILVGAALTTFWIAAVGAGLAGLNRLTALL